MREEERNAERRRHGGLRLGGLISLAVGIGMMVFLRAVEYDKPVYLVGLIPLLIGVALLAYSYLLAPKE
jgi:cadmium resistance protein CadD (predicted permease)